MSATRVSILLGAALVFGGAAGAGAADLYGGSIKDSYAAPMAAPMPSWYVRIDGTYGTHDDPIMVENGILDLVDTDIDDAWSLGGGLGRYFGTNFRGDVTYDHRFETDVEGTLAGHANALPGVRSFGLESDVVLFNAYYDFDRGSRFSPYVGLGLGVVHHDTSEGTVSNDCGCDGTIDSGSSNHVAGAVMTGFTAKLRGGQTVVEGSSKDGPMTVDSGRALYLDVGYRFLYLGETSTGEVRLDQNNGPTVVSKDPTVEDIHAHEFRVGLRYDFR